MKIRDLILLGAAFIRHYLVRRTSAPGIESGSASPTANGLENQGSEGFEVILDEMSSGRVPPYSIEGTLLLLRFRGEPVALDDSYLQSLFALYHAKLANRQSRGIDIFFRSSQNDDHRILALSLFRDLLKKDSSIAENFVGFFASGWIEMRDVAGHPAFFGDTLSSVKTLIERGNSEAAFLGYIPKTSLESLKPFGQFEQSSLDFYGVRSLTDISNVLETYLPLEAASYFRNPEDLGHTLNYLAEKLVENELDEVKNAFSRLRSFRILENSDFLLNSYKSFLNLFIRLYRINPNLKHQLASCITLAENLLPPSRMDEELNELLNWCLQFRDLRIKANAIATLGHFDPKNSSIENYLTSKFNRIASEAIIIKSRSGLSEEVTSQILTFLNSSNPYFVASGLYIVGSVCEYHFHKNHDFFKSHKNFKILIDRAKVFSNHTHSMVRGRAKTTLKIVNGLKGAA